MRKILLVFALKREAEATLRKLDAKPLPNTRKSLWLDGEVSTCYSFSHGWILLTDVGSQAAKQAVSAYAPQVDEIWNLGFAGALDPSLPLGSLIEIGTVTKSSLPPLSLTGRGSQLVTSDIPIHSTIQREELSHRGSLIDMEGYGVASAANAFDKPCRMWKIVSDFASPEGRALIQQNRHKLSELLAEKILEEFSSHKFSIIV